MKKKQKTKTLCDASGTPLFTILKGRRTKAEFNRAYKEEGWVGGPVDIDYAWILKLKNNRYKIVSINNLKAEIYTINYW